VDVDVTAAVLASSEAAITSTITAARKQQTGFITGL
jgi:hypothetical protein